MPFRTRRSRARTWYSLTGNAILASLSEGLDICPNTRVSHISYSNDGVSVGDMDADYVVCTVSLGVLKAGAAVFEPALPRVVQDAIDALGFGTVTKIALKFGKPFWELETQYFGIMTEPKGRWNYWLNYRTVSVENILLGLPFGQYAPVAERMNREDMTQDAISVLTSVWGRCGHCATGRSDHALGGVRTFGGTIPIAQRAVQFLNMRALCIQ